MTRNKIAGLMIRTFGLLLLTTSAWSAGVTLPTHPMGNGEGYPGGPPSHAYFRLDPAFTCPAGSAVERRPGYRSALQIGIDFSHEPVEFRRTSYNPCTDVSTPLAEAEGLGESPSYTPTLKIVFFRGELFQEMQAPTPNPIDSSPIAWCTTEDGTPDFGTEVIVHADGEASIWISSPSGDPRVRNTRWVSPFTVSHRVNSVQNTIRVKAPAFDLRIDAPRADAAPGVREARFTANIDQAPISLALRCRMNSDRF